MGLAISREDLNGFIHAGQEVAGQSADVALAKPANFEAPKMVRRGADLKVGALQPK